MESFAYSRSMTLPPYNEGVQWLVARTAQFTDNKQLRAMRIIGPSVYCERGECLSVTRTYSPWMKCVYVRCTILLIPS